MEYRDRAKNRKLKRHILNTVNVFKLNSINLSTSKKIVLAWIFFGFIALFLKWADSSSAISKNTGNSFSDLVWGTWYWLLILQLLVIFLLLSKKNKDKIKLSIDTHVKDYLLVIIAWIFTIVSSITALNFINWLQHFSSDLLFWTWIILEICAWIAITAWWIWMRRDFRKNINKVYINDSEDEEEEIDTNKNNMSLPF